MGIPTNPEKLCIPALPRRYIPRPRLDRIWDASSEGGLLLVTAGAGYGKTSYLAARARAGESCWWYSLDQRDTDLSTFCAHLLACAGSAAEPDHAGPRAASTKGSDQVGQRDAVGPGDAVLAQQTLTRLIRRLRRSPGTTLVLDDAQFIREAQAIVGLLEGLIRYLPAKCRLVISSRETLPLPESRARLQGVVRTLTARDLEFRPDEVAALFAGRFGGATPSAAMRRRLVAETEGWAAGLEILVQALDGCSEASIEGTLARFRCAGTGWFGFFAQEVIRRLDPTIRDFLDRSSVLPRLTARICDEVLGRRDSREILESLVQRNLFTVPIGDEEASYRYHHLFRAFLRERLSRSLSPEELRRHCVRAAESLSRLGAWAEAAEASAEAGDPGTTLRLIEKAGERMLASGRYEAVHRAFTSIPEALLRRSPEGLFLRARLLDYQNRWAEAQAIYRRALRLHPSADRRIELMSLVAQIAARRGRRAEAIRWCRRALASRGRKSTRTQGRLLATIGVCLSELGRMPEAEAWLNRASALFRRRGDPAGEARIDYLLAANIYLVRGEHARAKAATLRALGIYRRLRDTRRICFCLGVLSLVACEAGELQEARELAEEGVRLTGSLGLAEREGICWYVLGRCDLVAGTCPARANSSSAPWSWGWRSRKPTSSSFHAWGWPSFSFARGTAMGRGSLPPRRSRWPEGRGTCCAKRNASPSSGLPPFPRIRRKPARAGLGRSGASASSGRPPPSTTSFSCGWTAATSPVPGNAGSWGSCWPAWHDPIISGSSWCWSRSVPRGCWPWLFAFRSNGTTRPGFWFRSERLRRKTSSRWRGTRTSASARARWRF